MKIRLRITGIVMAMVCAVSGFVLRQPMTAEAVTYSDEIKYGDYLYYQKFDENMDGTYDYVEISDCDESALMVVIPAEIDGLPVTRIGSSAFMWCTNLLLVNIPDSVTEIDSEAFYGCSRLPGITIPDSVTKIGVCAFFRCSCLASLTIPDSVTEISIYAFYGCSWLESITISRNVTRIGVNTFEECSSLRSITIPDNVTNIDSYAFSGCSSLESIPIENPECEIYDDKSTISDTATIYGYENSTAQSYAEKYSRNFVSLGEYVKVEIIQGDISGNGKIDLYDAIEICKSIMGMRTFTDEENEIADYDGNGVVDLYDAIGIAKELLPK